MGTNYYLRLKPCLHCNRSDKVLHIGKNSFGWTFTFHATDKIKSWKDWKKELKKGKIFDEYDRKVSFKDFVELVESKKSATSNHAKLYKNGGSFLDREGNSFSPYEFS